MTAVGLDLTAAGVAWTSGTTAKTFTLAAPAGDDIDIFIEAAANQSWGSTVTVDGTPAALVDSGGVNSTSPSSFGGMWHFKAIGAGKGAANPVTISLTPSASTRGRATALATSNVNARSAASKFFVQNTAISSGAITVPSGALAICVFHTSDGGIGMSAGGFTSNSGGTQVYLNNDAANAGCMLILTSAADTTFSAGIAGSTAYPLGGYVIILSPPSGSAQTSAPGSATVTATGGQASEGQGQAPGTATVSATGGSADSSQAAVGGTSPGAATVTVTGGQASQAQGQSPGSATVGVTGGAAAAAEYPSTPLGLLIAKLTAQQDAILFVPGDSTAAGTGDALFIGGWVTRLAILLAKAFGNASVKTKAYNGTSYAGTWTTRYAGTGPHTLYVYNGGVGGTYITEAEDYLANHGLIPAGVIPDAGMIAYGFNDIGMEGLTAAQFVSHYQAFVAALQAAAPGMPLVATTQDVASNDTSRTPVSYKSAFDALGQWLVGQDMPTSPPLQQTSVAGLWLLDTRQAFGNVYNAALMTDGLHPNAAGYDAEAAFEAFYLAGLVSPGSAVVTATGGPATQGQGQAPGAATVGVTGDQVAAAELSAGTSAPGPAVVTGTGGTAPQGQGISPGSATVGVTGGQVAQGPPPSPATDQVVGFLLPPPVRGFVIDGELHGWIVSSPTKLS